jgi:hypothetical protein
VLPEHFLKTLFNVFFMFYFILKKTCFGGFSPGSNSGNDEQRLQIIISDRCLRYLPIDQAGGRHCSNCSEFEMMTDIWQ